MKNSEMKALSVDELQGKLAAEQEHLSKLKFAHAISPLENPMQIKLARKLVARLQTELKARELQNNL
ncbi:MAG: 50S ribosomal protein L29 [Cyclobacteriaceae bacterium]|nr:50S ribosomal protein L29 [Cyclobacteriaceae bacterium]MCH8516159.1 50S ribosomal protein L29 [Cyclobacteriaceae bacterium]